MTVDVTDATNTEDESAEDAEDASEATDTDGEDSTDVDAESLGDPGKKALAAERAAARAAKRETREVKAENERLKQQLAAKDKPADEQELDRVRREADEAATKRADERVLRSEIRVAAAGKLADPADAALYLDLSEFEVGENGDVDVAAIEDAISDLLTRKPHLAAGKEKRFGNVNQSPKAPAKPGQLTSAEYNALTREERREARDAGRVKNILGAK